MRIYLSGRTGISSGEAFLDDRGFPSRQARLAFAFMAADRNRPVSREDLAEVVWDGEPPPAWERALSAIVSKLRTLLGSLPEPIGIEGALGCYQLRLPADAWVDVAAAADAVHRAEGLLRSGAPERALPEALVARMISTRPFLPGDLSRWAEEMRTRHAAVRLRSIDCMAEAAFAMGDVRNAVQDAELIVRLEPLRESGHRLLMRAHAAAGDRASALLAFERCRETLREELGTDPSPATEAVYLGILRAGAAAEP